MLEHFHPKWCVFIYSCLGFFVVYSGVRLNPEVDQEGLEEMNGFWKDLKRTFKEIWDLRKIPEIYKVLLFYFLIIHFLKHFSIKISLNFIEKDKILRKIVSLIIIALKLQIKKSF